MGVNKREILVVLDVNGLLVDRSYARVETYDFVKAENGRTLVFRPYLTEFMEFLFDNFVVGFWSSMSAINMYLAVSHIMKYCFRRGDRASKYCIDMNKSIMDDGVPFSERRGQMALTFDEEKGGFTIEKDCKEYKPFPSMKYIEDHNVSFEKFDMELYLDPNSVTTCYEESIRKYFMKILDVKQASHSSLDVVTISPVLMWTRRRCAIRNMSAKERQMSKDASKQMAVKNLSYLWGSTNHIEETSSPDTPKPHYIPTYGPIRPGVFYPEKTLLIDDSDYKFASTPFNGILVKTFDSSLKDDDELQKVIGHLTRLLHSGTSVIEFVRNNPFQRDERI